jgi:hypothetical protein
MSVLEADAVATAPVADAPDEEVPLEEEPDGPLLSASARTPPIAAATATPLRVSTTQWLPWRRACGAV